MYWQGFRCILTKNSLRIEIKRELMKSDNVLLIEAKNANMLYLRDFWNCVIL